MTTRWPKSLQNPARLTGVGKEAAERYPEKRISQKCTSKDIRRQGIMLKHRSSLQKSLCPVVVRPFSCSSEEWRRGTRSKTGCGLGAKAGPTSRLVPAQAPGGNTSTN